MINSQKQENIINTLNILLIVTIVYFLLFRVLNLTPDLINKHSWGESQYAMWASSYLRDGYFFGVREVDYFKPFTNYIPIASYLAASVSDLFATDLVFTGRMISFLFSVLSVVFFYKLVGIIFNDKFKALVTTVIFVVLPISMYYSGMLYNDPIHLFFIVCLTYLLYSKRDSAGIKFYYSSVFMLTILILLTKPTAAIIFGLPILYLSYDDWRNGRFDKKEFYCIMSALAIVVGFFIITRMTYSDAYAVEKDKLISQAVLAELGVYLKKAWGQLSFHFQHYYYIYIAALPIAAFSEARIRFFFFMSLGFFIFYALFIKGALIHQYYSLPFVVPFSIIVAYGMFKYTGILLKNKLWFAVVVIAVLIMFSPTKRHMYYMFKPEYSRDIMYVVETVKKIKGDKKIFVSAHGHKSFQYYLNIPYDDVRSKWGNRGPISELLDRKQINTLIVHNHPDASPIVNDIQDKDFRRIYCSSKYLVYIRDPGVNEVDDCVMKLD
ncbi:MAG: hypothetical protein HKP62_03350 [Sulfurovum sp.]|nr:glycosyltransferase family 39 protein [Sulfurovum sp.]NNJ45034.1 hypothetical protein [Sulfurovum sp.]